MDTCHGVHILTSVTVEGRKVLLPMYYVGRKDGQVRTTAKPHNAALMTEALAEDLVTTLTNTGHRAEVCELFCDENSTIHDNMVSIGEESPGPARTPTSPVLPN